MIIYKLYLKITMPIKLPKHIVITQTLISPSVASAWNIALYSSLISYPTAEALRKRRLT